MKRPKPRFKKGDFLYYINSFDEVKRAKVTGSMWVGSCWTYNCTEHPNFFYISDDKNFTSYPYKSKFDALIALRDYLIRKMERVKKELINAELEIEKL